MTPPPPDDAPNQKTPNNIVKIGPPLLEDATSFDPLRSIVWHDYFWNYVDNFFQPMNKDDVNNFRNLPPSSLSADEACNANSFPLTQRLVAALLDDGTPTPNSHATPANGITAAAAGAVAVGTMRERLRHQHILETRVRHELASVGLIDSASEDELQRATRATQWRYREVKASNAARHRALARLATVNDLRDQSERREKKRRDDNDEIAYLKIRLGLLKKSRKNRANILEILSHKFGQYDHVENTIGNKSKKRKSGGVRKGEPPANSKSDSPILIRGYPK